MRQSQTPSTLGIERKSRCTRPVIPGDDTITDSTNPWHWEKEQMHKTSYSRRWHNHRLHLPLALRADAQDQSYQEMTQSHTPPTLGIERKNRCTRPVIPGDDTITDSTYPWHWESRCTRLVIPGDDTITDSTNLWHREKEQMHKTSHIPGDDTITDSTNPWHREKEQMHKTSHTRRWHNHRLHQSLA